MKKLSSWRALSSVQIINQTFTTFASNAVPDRVWQRGAASLVNHIRSSGQASHENYPRSLHLRQCVNNHGCCTSVWKRSFCASSLRLAEPQTTKTEIGPDPAQGDPAADVLNLSLEMARASSNGDTKIRGTEFDGTGSPTDAGREFKRSQLISQYGLQSRDLRKLDTRSSSIPHIFVRPSTILVNVLQLRLLIQANRVLIFDTDDPQEFQIQSILANNLQDRLSEASTPIKDSNLPYELRALEAVMITITSGLEVELDLVQTPVLGILQELNQGCTVDEDILRRLLDLSIKLGTFEQKARLIRDAIYELLEADDDLAGMYLTDRLHGKPHAEHDHQEAELLLETYYKICDEVAEVCDKLQADMRRTEAAIKTILDAHRNQIMLLDVKMTIGTLGVGVGTLIAGFFGMNLVNYMEESKYGFFETVSVSLVLCLMVFWQGTRMLNRIRRHRFVEKWKGMPRHKFRSAMAARKENGTKKQS